MKIFVLGAAVLVGLAGCGFGAGTHEAREFDPPAETLVIDTNADVQVEPGADDRVEVERWLDGAGSWSMDGDTLTLRVKGGLFNFGGDGGRYAVTVPDDLAVEVRTSNGDVDISDLQSDVAVGSQNGDVRLSGLSSAVTVRADNGDIDLDATEPLESAQAESQNGDVTVDVADAHDYRIETDTQNGDKDIRVESQPDGRPLAVTTTNGDITIKP